MLYLVTFDNQRIYNFIKNEVRIVNCPKGKCPRIKFSESDWVLTMMPISKNYRSPTGGQRLNSDQAIRTSKNKPLSRKLLMDKGISVPKTWFDINKAIIPYIARPKYHAQGNDFIVIRDQEQHEKFLNSKKWDASWYFSELLNVKREVRIITLDDDLVYAFEFPLFETPEITVKKRHSIMGTPDDPGWNPDPNIINEEDKKLCIDALNAIGLKYGTADLLITDNGTYITEINYMPNLRAYIRPHFSEAIKRFKERHNIKN